MCAEPVRPQRLLMTTDAVGGIWTYALDLARALAPADVEIALAVLGPELSVAQRKDAARLPNVALFEHPGRLEWMDEPWTDVARAGEWLLMLERAFAPDVVHLNGYCHGALRWRAPVVIVGHSCVRSWWRAVRQEEPPSTWDRYTAEVARGLAAARCVVAPSHEMMASLQEHYGPLPRTRVIANGRSVRPRRRPKEPLVLAAGRLWDAAKNVEAVCAAAPALPWPVYIAGEAGGTPPPSANVTALGRLAAADLAEWMARASVYALPARYEPFGLSILEAAIAGCALVVGARPSLREVWGDAALYVEPDDHESLAATIAALIEDGGLRREMSARALVQARRYTIDAMADDYLAVYRELLESAGALPWGARLRDSHLQPARVSAPPALSPHP